MKQSKFIKELAKLRRRQQGLESRKRREENKALYAAAGRCHTCGQRI